MQNLYGRIFYSQKISGLFTDEAMVSSMLKVEAAIARAQADCDIIPRPAATVIGNNCTVEKIDLNLLIEAAPLGGNVIIPLVNQLTGQVAKESADAARYVHFGLTSQDIADTSLMIRLKEATVIIEKDLRLLMEHLVLLTKKHRTTLMTGRSFLHHARPITFGFKTAGWLDSLVRSAKSIRDMINEIFVLQLGGAVGTLPFMEGRGLQVQERLAETLGLEIPVKPWHAQRDRLATLASVYGVLSGNLGKIARDISLLSQTEIAEVMEPPGEGKGGSSAMPNKLNPVGCISILANVARTAPLVSTMLTAMVQDHERATGLWHAEWETITDLVQLTGGALSRAVEIIPGLVIDESQMLINMNLTGGLIFSENVATALSPSMDRVQAHRLVAECCVEARRKSVHLKEICSGHPVIMDHLSELQLQQCFDPELSLGMCQDFIERVLGSAE
jgi:3-carboxy-cis,cis-muconate cycloisomerase